MRSLNCLGAVLTWLMPDKSMFKPSFQQKVIAPVWDIFWSWTMNPLFAYLMLFLLQLKVIWGMWQYKDLTLGDTSSYFTNAHQWFENFLVNIIWSPLYTAFYGSLLYLSGDVYLVTILHRLIIIFAVTLMVLALMRQLLPPGLAWLAAAWWTILPINFNTLYEVHLFAVVPVLVAWLLILYQPNPWGRGGAIAILFGASILVRNELIVATAILVAFCLWWEMRLAKKRGSVLKPLAYLTGYGLPLLLAGLICLFFYTHSTIQFPELPAASAPKHTVNMCQVYAFGYQQRHPEWVKSPWTECYDLMESHFGKRLLPLSEMWRRNPIAVLIHFWWNTSLTPNGLQVLLFNATSGSVNPDYAPVQFGSFTALLLTIIVGAILMVGLILLYYERSYWWNFWLQDRVLGWLAMLAVVAVTLVVIPTQRPRPSYLFSLSIFLMALSAMSVFVISQRWFALQRLDRWLPLMMMAILLMVPNYYRDPVHISSRPLLTVYRRLAPFQDLIARPDTVFLKGEYAQEVRNYLGYGRSQAFDYNLLAQWSLDAPLEPFLNSRGIDLFYVDEILMSMFPIDPFASSFPASLQAAGWKLMAFQDWTGARWILFHKPPQPTDTVEEAAIDQTGAANISSPVHASATLTLGDNWYPVETFNGETFRWVNNDAEIIITPNNDVLPELVAEVEPGPSLGSSSLTLRVYNEAGTEVLQLPITGRQEITLKLPSLTPGKPHRFRLHTDSQGLPVPNDPRLLNFRVFRLGWKNSF